MSSSRTNRLLLPTTSGSVLEQLYTRRAYNRSRHRKWLLPFLYLNELTHRKTKVCVKQMAVKGHDDVSIHSPCGIWRNRHWLDSLRHAPPSTPGRTRPVCVSEEGWWWWAPPEWDGRRCDPTAGRRCRVRRRPRAESARGPRRSAWGGGTAGRPAADLSEGKMIRITRKSLVEMFECGSVWIIQPIIIWESSSSVMIPSTSPNFSTQTHPLLRTSMGSASHLWYSSTTVHFQIPPQTSSMYSLFLHYVTLCHIMFISLFWHSLFYCVVKCVLWPCYEIITTQWQQLEQDLNQKW